jgi:hypothetical protein
MTTSQLAGELGCGAGENVGAVVAIAVGIVDAAASPNDGVGDAVEIETASSGA